MISEFEDERPRTPKGEALKRERGMKKRLAAALRIKDERRFVQVLKDDFGITASDPRLADLLKVWREQQ